MSSRIINLSAEPLGKLHSWIPSSLQAEQIVFLPDACPGRSPLPTGTAVLTRQQNWRQFAVSDCGCGMRLVRSEQDISEVTQSRWDHLADLLKANKGKLGDLGGGNHFLDALADADGRVYFLIHTGSRDESGLVDNLVDRPAEFDATFARVVDWARQNREQAAVAIQQVFGAHTLVLDLPHNTYECLPDGSVVIRKGAVHLRPGERAAIPSHMAGDVALVRATERVSECLYSMSHGTGRTMPRGQSKALAEVYDFGELRRKVLMPTALSDASLRTEGPFAYRDLDDCLRLIGGFVEVEQRLTVVAYCGHL